MPEIRLKELLKKYLEGTATPEEKKLVDDWYESRLEKREVRLSDPERTALRNDYWHSLKEKIHGPSSRRRFLWRGLAVAASLLAIICVLFFLQKPARNVERISAANDSKAYRLIENNSADIREVKLPDSSLVKLSPGSAIRVSPAFNIKEREVQLSGQAFFDIAKNAQKPFYVFANEVTTRVLGTSFTVTAYPDDREVTVAVKSGKVSVYTGNAKNKPDSQPKNIILIPNQQAIYSRDHGTVSKTLVEDPAVVITEEEIRKIRFEGVAVSEIFKALEKMYGVDIEFEEQDFEKCTMTTSATGKDLYQRIDVICEITGATYSIEDGRIRINGSGCN